jgi:DNA-binding beta-propeller fold protein YncE
LRSIPFGLLVPVVQFVVRNEQRIGRIAMRNRLTCLFAALAVALVSTTTCPLLADHGEPEIVGTIELPRGVNDLGANSITNRIYAAAGDRVLVIDGATDTMLAEIPIVDGSANVLTVDELQDRIYVAGARSVKIIDGRFSAVIDSIPMEEEEGTPFSVAVDSHRGRLYVVTWDPAGIPVPGILLVDMRTGDSRRIRPDTLAGALIMDPVRDRLYVGGTGVEVLDAETHAVLARAPGHHFFYSHPRAVNAFDDVVYVTHPGDVFGSLRMHDGRTLHTIDAFRARIVGTFGAVAVNPFTRLVYTKVYPEEEEDDDCRVWGLDGRTGARVLDRPINCGGAGVALNPATDRAYVVAGLEILVIDGFHPGPARPVD